jgi:ribosomal protein S17E
MDIFMGKDYTSKELENAIQQYTTQYTKEGSEYFETYKATAVKKQ